MTPMMPMRSRCDRRFSRRVFPTTILSIALILPAALQAQGLPKQFEFSVTFTAASTGTIVPLGEKNFARSFTGAFTATNDGGNAFMHNMFGQCAGFALRVGEATELQVGCVYEDKDGDKLYETAKGGGGEGPLAFIGGTGKFAGIQCEGKYKVTANRAAGERSGAVGRKTGTCKFS